MEVNTLHNFELLTAKQLYDLNIPPIQYLVEDLILDEGITYLVGPPGSFKTNLMLYIAKQGAMGKDVFDFKTNKVFDTLWIDEENGKRRTRTCLHKLIDDKEIVDVDRNLVFSCITGFRIDKPFTTSLIQLLEKRKFNVIVIDNIARCLIGSERDEQDVAKVHNLLKPITEKYNVSFIIIHHTRKGDPNSLEDISGSRDFGGQCDRAFIIKEVMSMRKDDSKRFVVIQKKNKDELEIPAFNIDVSGDKEHTTVKYIGKAHDIIEGISKRKADDLLPKIIEWMKLNPKPKYGKGEIEKVFKDEYGKYSIDKAIKLGDMKGIFKSKYGWVEL